MMLSIPLPIPMTMMLPILNDNDRPNAKDNDVAYYDDAANVLMIMTEPMPMFIPMTMMLTIIINDNDDM